jgi:hypothetical protein
MDTPIEKDQFVLARNHTCEASCHRSYYKSGRSCDSCAGFSASFVMRVGLPITALLAGVGALVNCNLLLQESKVRHEI